MAADGAETITAQALTEMVFSALEIPPDEIMRIQRVLKLEEPSPIKSRQRAAKRSRNSAKV